MCPQRGHRISSSTRFLTFPVFFGFPAGLALWASNGAKFIDIAFTKVGTYLKEDKQQHNDERTEETENEKRDKRWHAAFLTGVRTGKINEVVNTR